MIAANYKKITDKIAARATLVAVTKTIESAKIEEVLALGQTHFGENYVQEALSKWVPLKERFDVNLHMIGPLQSNKAREAVRLFECIETLDRVSLAKALAIECDKQGKRPKLLIQVNIGEEPQKGGVLPQDFEKFYQDCQKNYGFEIAGLMAIPPADPPPRPYFKALRVLGERVGLSTLSMGMSGDYLEAIEEGASFVRVGSALFGARG